MEIIGLRVDPTSYLNATQDIVTWAYQKVSRIVCVANAHTIMEARDSKSFREIVEGADLVTPDGMPLVWLLKLKGHPSQTRVYGPILMLYLLERASREDIPVGLYGGSQISLQALIARLRIQFPKLSIVFSYSPPYREITHEEDSLFCYDLTQSGARILFVGLGCPKQERWMADHKGRINLVMIGVGAAFDFHAGVKPQAPPWMQNTGLEWLFRLLTEPRRLWRRYLLHNPRFIILAIADLLGLIH